MRIVGHGIDVVSIDEFSSEIESPDSRWLERFYSEGEHRLAATPPCHIRYYAGRFAVKEATVKALGTGFSGDITWRGIEVLKRESGAPYVILNGEVKALADGLGITDILVSITYSDHFAFASVIALSE